MSISTECWNIDYELILWLNKHLKHYREVAPLHIDLNFHKFKWNNKTYTQLQMIKKLENITDMLLEDYFGDKYSNKKKEKLKNKMYDILKIIHWSMWW